MREEVRRGAHHIKVYLSGAVDSPSDRVNSTQFTMEELLAIVEEATAANIYVAGHAYTSRAINRGLEAGMRTMDESSIPLFHEQRGVLRADHRDLSRARRRAKTGQLPAESTASCARS